MKQLNCPACKAIFAVDIVRVPDHHTLAVKEMVPNKCLFCGKEVSETQEAIKEHE